VGRTSTYALCNVTFPYVLQIAQRGLHGAAALDAGLANAVNMCDGRLTNKAVADTFGIPHVAYDPATAARKK
jgi:alanine dehydrogenase